MADYSTADELGSGKTGSLLLQYSLPSIVGITAPSLYNIIDMKVHQRHSGPFALRVNGRTEENG
jgi:hypothetical protein